MSISLIVVRLEVADSVVCLPDLSYNAPDFELPLTEKKSYAKVVEQAPTISQVQGCMGRREFIPITIETFHTEEVVMSSGESDNPSPRPASASAELSAPSLESSPQSVTSEETGCSSPPPPSTSSSRMSDAETSQSGAQATSTPGQATKAKKRVRAERVHSLSQSLSFESKEAESVSGWSGSRPGSSKGGKIKRESAGSSSAGNIIHFFSGNPAVESTEGVIHLYKQNDMVSLSEDIPRSAMVCMLMVPAAMTSHDILRFVAPVEPWVEHIKIIKDGTQNQYMVLIKFKSQKYADDFYKNFNNIPYNSIENDVCRLVYVARLETLKASEGASLPVAGLTELPVCPVCLERMDESVDSILTILCNHSFHSNCLGQWGDTTCPVCRFTQTPEAIADNICFQCNSSENLWICLICGHVGCGRYEGMHAHNHFADTNHTYAMQLENNRVWDYVGDNYVHRLVQSKGDGKMVEVDEGPEHVQGEKLDSITLEYTYLLTSQLEAQRHHYQEKIARTEKEAQDRVEELDAKSKKTLEQYKHVAQELTNTQKEKQCVDKKFAQVNSKLTKLQTELKEEKEMNKHLRKNQSQWQAKVSDMENSMQQKDQELKDLQEQLRDVMFYFEAQQKLSTSTEVSQEEIQDGQIVVQNTATGGATSGKRGRKKGGR